MRMVPAPSSLATSAEAARVSSAVTTNLLRRWPRCQAACDAESLLVSNRVFERDNPVRIRPVAINVTPPSIEPRAPRSGIRFVDSWFHCLLRLRATLFYHTLRCLSPQRTLSFQQASQVGGDLFAMNGLARRFPVTGGALLLAALRVRSQSL